MGYDARYVWATFDHVWTEVYSPFQNRWIHVDPSDNVVDSPLMYQHGWRRDLDYVIAYSRDDVTDVTWRYCNDDRQELLRRRTRCPEKQIEAQLLEMRKFLQNDYSEKKKRFLLKRSLLESVQLITIKTPTTNECQGRSSGDLNWRKSRGEQNDAVS